MIKRNSIIVFILIAACLFIRPAYTQDFQKRKLFEMFKSQQNDFVRQNRILQGQYEQFNGQLGWLVKEYNRSPSATTLKQINDLKAQMMVIIQKEVETCLEYIRFLEEALSKVLAG